MSKHRFCQSHIDGVYRAIYQRRDMRHFTPAAIDPSLLHRVLHAAHHGPSVGFMQPWRFIRITDAQLRQQIHALVEDERRATAAALGEREDAFMKLKVEGILDCGEVLVTVLMPNRDGHIFGRRTMPQMDLASAACAIQNLWLSARAEGLGLGWVSLFDPKQLGRLLELPEGSEPIAVLCLGHVDQFYPQPMLELEQWAERGDLEDIVMENGWRHNKQAEKQGLET